MLKNRSMPGATVIPELPYQDIGPAIDWLCDVFGFTLRLRIADHRAQMNVGDGAVVLIAGDAASPRRSLMVRVADVDAHYARAAARGAITLRDPATYPYGERQYSVEDCGGHLWTFSQSVADVDPASWGGSAGTL
jgi:uncharacterized glyoxalase superfamily protein PhnB